MFGSMNSWSFTSRLFLALALFGLVLGPLATASAPPAMAAQTMAAMPDGMPCCPDDQPARPDCTKDCPLAVLCLTGVVSAPLPETPSLLLHAPLGDDFLNGTDVMLSSLAGEPPPRPPKA